MTRLVGLALALALVLPSLQACSDTTDGSGGDGGDSSVLFPDVAFGEDGAEASDTGGETDVVPFDYPCEPLTIEPCVTSCLTVGQRLCLKDWGPCVPPAERCDNCVDDDCDGIVNNGCPPNPLCTPVTPECPIAAITLDPAPTPPLFTDTVLQLSAASSQPADGPITAWQWAVQAPAGSTATFSPSATVERPTFRVDVAGSYLFTLHVFDDAGVQSCVEAQLAVAVAVYPPLTPEVGCADGQREGFLDQAAYTHIAACAGAWTEPGVTPTSVAPTCGRQGGDDGPRASGEGCSAADLCAEGWHICDSFEEVAAKSPTGCAGATPAGAAPKSLLFAIRQPSSSGSVCGPAGSGDNDVFGCGNLGHSLGDDKQCGPLDRVLASTQADHCGFNEAMPPLGPWQCIGGPNSDLHEGATVTKKGCPGQSCSYDGQALGNSDKGGVLCCR